MPKVTEANYADVKSFVAAFLERLPLASIIGNEQHPIVILESTERKSMAQARRGLEMMLNDMLEMSRFISPGELKEMDAEFVSRGIVSLSEMRRRYGSHYRRILKRGRILNEEEYYLMAGVIASARDELTDEEATKLDAMLFNFEPRKA